MKGQHESLERIRELALQDEEFFEALMADPQAALDGHAEMDFTPAEVAAAEELVAGLRERVGRFDPGLLRKIRDKFGADWGEDWPFSWWR